VQAASEATDYRAIITWRLSADVARFRGRKAPETNTRVATGSCSTEFPMVGG